MHYSNNASKSTSRPSQESVIITYFQIPNRKKKKKIQKSTLNVPLSCIKEFLRTGKTEHSIIAAAAGEKKKYQNCL